MKMNDCDSRAIAEALYSMCEDMDAADYEEQREETIAEIAKEVSELKHCSVLLEVLKTLAEFY